MHHATTLYVDMVTRGRVLPWVPYNLQHPLGAPTPEPNGLLTFKHFTVCVVWGLGLRALSDRFPVDLDQSWSLAMVAHCSKIAEAEAAVSVNENMVVHVQSGSSG
jgi:hypothetical protein